MRNRKSVFALALLSMISAAASLVAADIHGSVIDAVSGSPVPRAHVTLLSESNGKPVRYGAASGADGSFSFAGIPAGAYEGLADHTGYVDQNGTGEGRVEIKLGADESKTGIAIKLTPTGSISGRVIDSEGEPVEGAAVTAGGSLGAGSGITDEKGQYRIGGLPPGKFRVRARHGDSTSQDKPEIRTDGTVEVHDAETYYPGVIEAREAGRIEVRGGTETPGADIRLVRIPFVRVSGHVVGLPKDIRASLMINRGNDSTGEELQTDGRFEIWRLEPGKYGLSAEWQAPNGERVKTVEVPIEVANSNIDDIELRVVPPADIAGHLEFDDDEARQLQTQTNVPPEAQRREIQLEGDEFAEGSSASIEGNGSFQLRKVQAGKYRVRVSWGETWIKSMRLGSTVIDGADLDLSNGSGGAELSIRIAAAKSSISGTVQGTGEEHAGLAVVLKPWRETEDPFDPDMDGYAFESEIKPDGSYSFDHLPPGSYRIGVVPEKHFAFQDDDENQMEAVELGANDKVTRDLKIPARP